MDSSGDKEIAVKEGCGDEEEDIPAPPYDEGDEDFFLEAGLSVPPKKPTELHHGRLYHGPAVYDC